MAWSGINKKKLASFGGEAHCFMSDDDVAKEAKERAQKAKENQKNGIIQP